MSVNTAAFFTSAGLAGATVCTVIAAATTASIVATVAYSILGITLAAISIASITAWFDPRSTDVASYFANIKGHAGYAITAMYQFVAQSLVMALVQGLANGISNSISRKFA